MDAHLQATKGIKCLKKYFSSARLECVILLLCDRLVTVQTFLLRSTTGDSVINLRPQLTRKPQ